MSDAGHAPPTGVVHRRRLLAVAAAAVAIGLGVLLYLSPPTERSWWPRCYFHRMTGLHCPGCGATRCLYFLLHGDLGQAASQNLLFLLVLPLLVFRGVWVWLAALRGQTVRPWPTRPWLLWLFLALMVVFWVVRNLPYYPFTLLAPHTL